MKPQSPASQMAGLFVAYLLDLTQAQSMVQYVVDAQQEFIINRPLGLVSIVFVAIKYEVKLPGFYANIDVTDQ